MSEKAKSQFPYRLSHYEYTFDGQLYRERGSEIGLDRRFTYFRHKQQPHFTAADNAALLKWFDEYPVPSTFS